MYYILGARGSDTVGFVRWPSVSYCDGTKSGTKIGTKSGTERTKTDKKWDKKDNKWDKEMEVRYSSPSIYFASIYCEPQFNVHKTIPLECLCSNSRVYRLRSRVLCAPCISSPSKHGKLRITVLVFYISIFVLGGG